MVEFLSITCAFFFMTTLFLVVLIMKAPIVDDRDSRWADQGDWSE
jgi:hypothetical protein